MILVSIIMPALNEAPSIQEAILSIPVDEFRISGYEPEILVVGNGSEDGTGGLAKEAGARVVVEPIRGYGRAYQKGFKEARGSIICALDADQTYPAFILPNLVSKLVEEDLEFISTNRFAYLTNGSMTRRNRWGNVMLTMASRALFQIPFQDSQSGMWVFKTEVLQNMNLRAHGMALSEEIKIQAWRQKRRCVEIPIPYHHRNGSSKLHLWRDGFGNLVHLARLRFT